MDENIWQEEQQRVSEVIAKIDERLEALEEELGEAKSEVVEIRRRFWEDVTVNLSEPDDRIETAASMRQQAETLADRE